VKELVEYRLIFALASHGGGNWGQLPPPTLPQLGLWDSRKCDEFDKRNRGGGRGDRQRRNQEFDLGGYKWVDETKQPHEKFKVDWFGGYIYRYTPRRYAPGDGLAKSSGIDVRRSVTAHCSLQQWII